MSGTSSCRTPSWRAVSKEGAIAWHHPVAVNVAALDMSVRLQCDFRNFEHCKAIECSVYPYYPRERNTVHLRRCTKNIRSHLQKWKVAAYDVNVEWKLILLRCGLFDVDAYSDKTICPAHRYKLGLCWTSTRKCCHPLHEGKGKPFRGVNKTTSREVFDRWGTLIPVGTGKNGYINRTKCFPGPFLYAYLIN